MNYMIIRSIRFIVPKELVYQTYRFAMMERIERMIGSFAASGSEKR